jgi:Pentapeptide repeats (8 copies)
MPATGPDEAGSADAASASVPPSRWPKPSSDLGPWLLVAVAIALVALAQGVGGAGAAAITAGAVTATGLAALISPDLGGPRGRAWVAAAVAGGMGLSFLLTALRDPSDRESEDARDGDAAVTTMTSDQRSATSRPDAGLPASLDYARLAGATLQRVDLTGADLRHVDLSGADLAGADLSDACLEESDLTGARLDGATFSGADLTGATFGPSQAEEAIDFPDDAAMDASTACD